ncbi:MAG: response regulator [Proteobacteria bacterium]|nr:response regulator [Pseudomonadota bacterium]
MAVVLLIEDDPRYRMMMRSMLEVEGHIVRSTTNGEEGIESFGQNRPDVVITDMIMPRRDGIETIGLLRQLDSSVPIVAVSGASEDVLMVARTIGAVATLAKPFSAPALLKAVADAVGTPSIQ